MRAFPIITLFVFVSTLVSPAQDCLREDGDKSTRQHRTAHTREAVTQIKGMPTNPWETYKFLGTQLHIKPFAPIDTAHNDVYTQAYQALRQAVLAPETFNLEASSILPAWAQLIKQNQEPLNLLESAPSTLLRPQAGVTSLRESQDIIAKQTEQYEDMANTFTQHLIYTHQIASILHGAIAREQKVRDNLQAKMNDKKTKELLESMQKAITTAETNITAHKNRLVETLCLCHTLYPYVRVVEPSFVSWLPILGSTIDSVAQRTAASWNNGTEMQNVTGIAHVPNEITIAIPGHDTTEKAYRTYLQQMFCQPAWVIEQATNKERMKWLPAQ